MNRFVGVLRKVGGSLVLTVDRKTVKTNNFIEGDLVIVEIKLIKI